MAGRGPTPKHPDNRARHNKPPEMRVIMAAPIDQPDLPSEVEWPARTRQWWQMWRDSPLSAEFTSTDWSELMDTALLHAKFWNEGGATAVAGELRLRVAKFGATPEDRARLKITFAAAEEADARRDAQPSARARYGGLRNAS